MTASEWDLVLCGDYLGKTIKSGDEIIVVYRQNWHRGRAYKTDNNYVGQVAFIDQRGVVFADDKKLSYKSLYDISFHTLDDDLPDCIPDPEGGYMSP